MQYNVLEPTVILGQCNPHARLNSQFILHVVGVTCLIFYGKWEG